jgi:hypothetical protein
MTISARKSFPLQWPDGWRRTADDARKAHKNFGTMFSRDRDSILKRLNKRGANAVITSDLPLRKDGIPYADSRCADTGIAVYWYEYSDKWNERVLACDHWRDITQNIRAISLTIEAICGIDRWGCTEIIERAFAGFTALPAAGESSRRRTWREVFDMDSDVMLCLGTDEQLLIVKGRFRKLMSENHPDKGGGLEAAAEINVAMEQAEKELTGP